MPWDATKQFTASFPGGTMEFGYATLATTTEYVEVPTRLSRIDCAIATYKEAPVAATRLVCDCVITSGAVTIGDVEGVQSASKVVNYVFIGHA